LPPKPSTPTTGIRITLSSGLYRAEATDGRRAVVVQGLVPIEDPPWPGFKEVPDDACEAIVLPKDLERACKVGDQFVQSRFDMVGMATVGDGVLCLCLGTDLVTARTVEGRFPQIDNVMPRKRPMFTFRIDPKLTAETLLTMAVFGDNYLSP
jgi:DNA polymerase III sliding clamp (beta) subunit (PCNA family)